MAQQPYMNSSFELAGPLAGLFGGIQQGQQEESTRLQNIYQDLLNQRYGAETPAKAAEAKLNEAIATGKLEGSYAPAAVEAAVGAEKAKVDEQQLKRYENNIDIARNAIFLGMPPEQVAARFGITSGPVFDAFIKDPNGTLDGIWGNIQKRKVQDTKHLQKLEEIEATGEQQRKTAQVRAAAGGAGGDKYKYNTNKILSDAADGDPHAQQMVNLMFMKSGYAQSGAPTLDPVTGQLVTKGSTMKLPYPDAGIPKEEQTGGTGGGSYNYVPGQGLQPVGGGASAQRKPPVAGRQAAVPTQDNSAPYIKQGGGVVDPSTGKTYSYDEYVSSRLSQQYPYSDLKVK